MHCWRRPERSSQALGNGQKTMLPALLYIISHFATQPKPSKAFDPSAIALKLAMAVLSSASMEYLHTRPILNPRLDTSKQAIVFEKFDVLVHKVAIAHLSVPNPVIVLVLRSAPKRSPIIKAAEIGKTISR